MKRRLLPIVVGIPVLAVLILVYVLARPYILGKQAAREMQLTGNLLIGFKRPYKPVVISTEKGLKEIIENAKRQFADGRAFDALAAEQFGLPGIEKCTANVNFAVEYLLLVPVTHGYDYQVGLSAPFLRSGKLTLQVWKKDPPYATRHPSIRTECFGVTVKRELVKEVEILGADGGHASIVLP